MITEQRQIKGKCDWPDLWNHLGMERDNAGRWYPTHDTPASEYIHKVACSRQPSRAWPHSYAKALLTYKFAEWLRENYLGKAKEIGLM